ncbi:MAG: serine hydrolase, partial [Planctomycetota bacterium]
DGFHSYALSSNVAAKASGSALPPVSMMTLRSSSATLPANAAASLITTPRDYGLFLRAMLNAEGLSARSRDAMLTPQIDVPDTSGAVAWGVGWGLEPARGTFFHWGDDGAAKSFAIGALDEDRATVYFANSYYGMAIAGEISGRLIPGESPAVEWLGYAAWDDPKRLARRDTLRAFVDGDADLGMETFERYGREYPELDMENLASFQTWVLDGREKHEGRARLLAWQIERNPESVDLYLEQARSLRALGDLPSAMEAVRRARPFAGEDAAPRIDARLAWVQDEVLAEQSGGNEPAPDASLLAGSYETWRVFSEDDRLVFQPGEGRKYTLRWMHGTTFALEEIDWFRLRFVIEDGRASRLIGRYSDGRTDESERSGDPG